ncbi:MAG: DUF692 family multinuclear iron-containing protein [Bryobacteraceae bacterium]
MRPPDQPGLPVPGRPGSGSRQVRRDCRGNGGLLIPSLGIGFPYIAELPAELYRSGLIDFVEVTPETICRQRAVGKGVAIEIVPEQMDRARQTCASLPMVIHGVELSIGSAHGWNPAYLEMLDAFQAMWPFVWHSEHLGFQTIPGGDGASLEVGVPLPVPPTKEAADLIGGRAAAICRRYQPPFLLENPAYYISDLPCDREIGDDIGLINAIMDRSGCFLLLDLHNVFCNSLNHRIDPLAVIDRAPLDRVVEIHVAGGASRDGFWMDGHNSRVPEPVWELLEYTLSRAPRVGGVVFEMLDDFAVALGAKAIGEELRRAGEIWHRCRAS